MILSGSLRPGSLHYNIGQVFPVDINAFISIIQTIGFPIACVIAMFYYWNKEREDHKAEIDSMKEALNNNTLVLQSIRDHLLQK